LTLCGAYAAAAPEEPHPTTSALLEKLQEVLEKADVEVLATCVASATPCCCIAVVSALGAAESQYNVWCFLCFALSVLTCM